MKIITENAHLHARMLADAIKKDPLSWNDWMFLHLAIPKGVITQGGTKLYLKDIVSHHFSGYLSCSIFLDDGDVIIMAREAKYAEMRALGEALCLGLFYTEYADSAYKIFNIRSDWKKVIQILTAKSYQMLACRTLRLKSACLIIRVISLGSDMTWDKHSFSYNR